MGLVKGREFCLPGGPDAEHAATSVIFVAPEPDTGIPIAVEGVESLSEVDA